MVKVAASVLCGVLGLGFIRRACHTIQHRGWSLSQKTQRGKALYKNCDIIIVITYKLQTNEVKTGTGPNPHYDCSIYDMCAGVASLAWRPGVPKLCILL